MNKNKILSTLYLVSVWTPIIFFSVILAYNSLLYFSFDPAYGILPEKTEAMKAPLWTVTFYVHVLSGIFCLLLPFASFLGKYVGIGYRGHSITGLLYVFISLILVSPTGMHLALYAKGGIVAQTGFLVQGILLSLFTYQGYRLIKTGNRDGHIQWMIRSYAITASALSFRIFHILFFFTNLSYDDNYGMSQWLSIVVNTLIAEIIIVAKFSPKNSFQLNSKRS